MFSSRLASNLKSVTSWSVLTPSGKQGFSVALFWGLPWYSYKQSRSFILQQLLCIFTCIPRLCSCVSGLLYVAVAWILGWSLLRDRSLRIVAILHWLLLFSPLCLSSDYWPRLALLSFFCPCPHALAFPSFSILLVSHCAGWVPKIFGLKSFKQRNQLFLLCHASLVFLKSLRAFSARCHILPYSLLLLEACLMSQCLYLRRFNVDTAWISIAYRKVLVLWNC